jgi:hypothetical protein
MAAKSRDAGTSAGPRSDAYTGMLLISLLAQIAAVIFLYLDWSQYPTDKPKEPPAITISSGTATGPGPGAAGPGGPPPGGAPKGPTGK